MIEVFNNAERSSSSAWSWPSTHLSHKMADRFEILQPHIDFNPPPSVLSYVNPMQHCDLMKYIVAADKPNLYSRISSALAVSIAVDGSVDRFQVDNKHVKCKLVSRDGQEKDISLCFDEADERKTAGYVR
jgi:hypothetical protein